MVNSNVSLDVSKNGTQATVYVNQHEVETRSLVISLNNDGKKLLLPENYYATAHAVIDGKTYSNEAKIEKDKILFTFPSSYFDKSGKFELQVRIQRVSGEKSYVLYSPKIQIVVSKSIYDSDAVTGTTEYDRFTYDVLRMQSSQINSIVETIEDKKHIYTVTFNAGNTQTFIVYDGKDGKNGENGKDGVDAVEGIKKIIYNGSELTVSDDKTVEFNAQPYIKEFDFINDESEIEKLTIGKLYIVTKEMEVDGLTYYPGSLIMQTDFGIAGFGNSGFAINGELFPLWSEIQNGIIFKKTQSGYVVSIDGKETELNLPTKTSELENNSNFVSDENYIHTDNNYTTEEKLKLDSLVNYDDAELKKQISSKQDELTDAQLDNINAVPNKQDKLTAGENIVINNSVISSTCVIKPLALSTNKSSPTMLTDIGAGAFIASNTGYVQTSGGFNKLIGAGAELIIVNTNKDGVTQLCTTVQTGSSVLLFWDTMTSDETNENFISTLSIKKEITDNLTDRQVLSALLTKTLLENKADKNNLVMEPLDLSANTLTNPLLLSSLSKNVQDTIDSGYIVTQSGYIKTDGGFSITVGAGSEVLLTWVNNSGTAELCATVQNGYNLYAITNTMTSTDEVILYLTTNTIKTDINKTLTNRQVLGALYTKELLAGKIDTTAVGDGLKYENGKLSLDIPVATASTTYGG